MGDPAYAVQLRDVALMPGFDDTASNRGVEVGAKGGQRRADGTLVNVKVVRVAEDTAHSVTNERVYYGTPRTGGGLPTACCEEHGAMLCVAHVETGKLWRCPECNQGAYESNW